jgi:predicted transglutaminase-like cysteine proteinase
MPALHLTRDATATALVVALAFVVAGTAHAAPRESAPEATTMQPASPATARSFTINEILARQETSRPGAAGKFAAVERDGAASDAARPGRGVPGPEPFGMFALIAPDGELWTKWRGIEQDLAREAKLVENCRDGAACAPETKRYLAIVGEVKARSGRARLETANRLMNGAIRYLSDAQQHGAPDRWTAPLASLAAGLGDCEDFAIAKYVVLRDAGVAEADMRMVLVRDTSIRIDHAVLAVRQDGEWLILDNRKSFAAEPGELRHYTPLFALDHEGVKLFAAPLANWGAGELSDWTLRGSDGGEFADWTLRRTVAEPAATH